MRFEVSEEIKELKEKLQDGKMETDKSNNFIDAWNYEDEYSHNEIGDIQDDFLYHAKEYLRENYKGQYAITHGVYCVHIITTEYQNIKNLKNWTVC